MFHADITFVLALIVLVAGAFLLFFTKTQKEIPANLYKFIGFAVVILSIIMILCSGYRMVQWHFIRGRMMCHAKMMRMMQKPMFSPMLQKSKMKMPLRKAPKS